MTGLFFYKILFMTELLIAEGLFTFRMAKRSRFGLRAAGAVVVCYLAAFFFPVIEGVSYNGWYASLMFLLLFAFALGAVMFVYKISLKNAFFVSIAAYTAQHLAYEIFRSALMPFDFMNANNMYGDALIDFNLFTAETYIVAFVYVDIYIAVYGAVYFFLGRKMNKSEDFKIKKMHILMLAAAILLVDVVLNAIVIYVDTDYNKIYNVIIAIYNILCCILVFYLQHSLIDIKDMQRELDAVSLLLSQAQQQYELKKEEINLINIKCHDMKYRLNKYAAHGGIDEDTIAEITDMISIYDATVKTGNEVLDTILTEKSLKCQSSGINLTCMADCSDLDFVSGGDLYALFGNIVDNAMEAVAGVDDKEKMCISINVHTVGGCVSVVTQNYFKGEIVLGADGFPRTKKQDANMHGFGLRSISAIVKKYGGSLSFKADGEIFTVNVLLPVAAAKPKTP